MKKNCWEYKNCGKEPGGPKASELGTCPAAVESKLHGIHDGKNAGRSCWIVAGTLCKGEVQGMFAKKFYNCMKCEFYQHVQQQEGAGFKLSVTLLNKLGKTA